MLGRVLAERVIEVELMDDPQLEPRAHAEALRGLTRINRISGSTPFIWGRIRRLARELDRPLRVLDLATGGGDLPLGIARRARQAGVAVTLTGCDVSARAVRRARARARRAGLDVSFFVLDALNDPLPADYDVLTCALFLHHLDDAQIVALLRRMGASARCAVLADDLVRSRRGWLAAYIGTRALTRSPIVHVDALRSVRAALTVAELAALARTADLDGCTIQQHWPWRQLLEWRRK